MNPSPRLGKVRMGVLRGAPKSSDSEIAWQIAMERRINFAPLPFHPFVFGALKRARLR